MSLPVQTFYDRHAASHDEANQLDDLPDDFRSILNDFIDSLQGDRVLDAGCGAGRDTEYFHNNDLDAVGIDISGEMIERARQNRPGTYTQMNLLNLSFNDNSFDGVWCPATIFFLEPIDMMQALLEFRRILTDNGVLRIGFKIGDGPYEVEKWGDTATEHHINEDDARQLLNMARFKIDDSAVFELDSDRTFANFSCHATTRYTH